MPSAARQSLRNVLAQKVRAERQRLGWSQEALADRAELHRTFVGFVERGETNISLDNLEKIARALDVEAWALLRPTEQAGV